MVLVKSDMWNDKAFDKAVKALPALYGTEEIKAQDKIMAVHCFIDKSEIQLIEPEMIAIDNEYDAAMESYCS